MTLSFQIPRCYYSKFYVTENINLPNTFARAIRRKLVTEKISPGDQRILNIIFIIKVSGTYPKIKIKNKK